MNADVAPGTVEWQLFDCVQVNLAVLADRWHGPGTHLDLGAVLRFRPVPGPDGLPTVERSAADQLTETAHRLGLTVLDLRTTRPGEAVAPAAGRYLVADAYHLPWVPYFGRRHMDHSFLLEPADGTGAVVVDGYHNDTPWGGARPVSRPLSRAELAAAVPGPALSVTLAPAETPTAPAAAGLDLADEEVADRYVTAYAEHPDRLAALDRLTLETWLLARSRKLHARFLHSRGVLADDPTVLAHVRAWEQLAESVYLGYRRVERGRPAAGELFTRLAEQLGRDREVFGSGTAARAPDPVPADRTADRTPVPAALRERVAASAGAVLRTDPAALLGGQPLADVPGFTSFRVVEIVERLERELSVEFVADDLVPENLHHVDGICRIVLRALPTGTTAPSPARPVARTGGN
ncbi:hypothetical protein ABZ915_39615 [Streptomyces sp. NPDC046915]|uniref:acyl carrier protein n=1 Tax=Streptomyces sp. NPDC046915 TaxID=3155257 RepID=UPI0033E72F3A